MKQKMDRLLSITLTEFNENEMDMMNEQEISMEARGQLAGVDINASTGLRQLRVSRVRDQYTVGSGQAATRADAGLAL
jgi:hypothetical protein